MQTSTQSSYGPVYRGIFLLALGTLLFEIALIRVLSFTIWYHFAYVVISTALLGFGASGTLLAVRPSIGTRDLHGTLARLSLAAAGSAALALLFVSSMPLHPMRIFAEGRQLVLLVAYQLVATIPFFFSGLGISLSLREAARNVDRLYFWDLVGGGLGCALAVPLMNAIAPPGAVLVSAAALALAAVFFTEARTLRVAGLTLGAVLLLASPFAHSIPFVPADSKHMSMQRNVLHFEPVFSDWTALFRTDVLRSTEASPKNVRPSWGLPPGYEGPFPGLYGGIHHDASAGTALWDLRESGPVHLEHHIFRTPYVVAPKGPRVLVIGVGGGIDVLAALHFGASHVTGVELDPVTVRLVREEFAELSRDAFNGDDVVLVAGEGRHFVEITDQRFDVIQITGVDTLAAQTSGAYVLAENYLYTAEAFGRYLERLRPGGVLSITTACTGMTSPRITGRMVSVAQKALRDRGIANPADHIAVVFSGHLYATILVRNDPFEPAEVATLERESTARGFAPLLLPGRTAVGVFGQLAGLDGNPRRQFLEQADFHIGAVTDDSPFFFRFYRWSRIFDVSEVDPLHASALGQIVLLVLLGSLSALGALFVLTPLAVFRRRGVAIGGGAAFGILGYFLAIGLGFMLFEISLLQRFILYLGYPTYSLSVVLFTLLVSLGCGSFLSRRWVGRERVALPTALVLLAALTVFLRVGLPVLQAQTLGASLAIRVAISIAALFPLGLVLGIFFPLGIRRAESVHPDLVPWAWGINGCASVTATVLTVVLAMTYGFATVWTFSLVIYAAGVAALLGTWSTPQTQKRQG